MALDLKRRPNATHRATRYEQRTRRCPSRGVWANYVRRIRGLRKLRRTDRLYT